MKWQFFTLISVQCTVLNNSNIVKTTIIQFCPIISDLLSFTFKRRHISRGSRKSYLTFTLSQTPTTSVPRWSPSVKPTATNTHLHNIWYTPHPFRISQQLTVKLLLRDLWMKTLTKILLSTDNSFASQSFSSHLQESVEKPFGIDCFVLLLSHIKKTLQGICFAVLRNVSHKANAIYEENAADLRRSHTAH